MIFKWTLLSIDLYTVIHYTYIKLKAIKLNFHMAGSFSDKLLRQSRQENIKQEINYIEMKTGFKILYCIVDQSGYPGLGYPQQFTKILKQS